MAFGATTLTSNIGKLVLYEGWHVPARDVFALPAGVEARMDALLVAGARDAVVELLFRELEEMSDEDMAAFKAAPSWPGRVAAAHTITREIRGERTAALMSSWRGRSRYRCCWSPVSRAPTRARWQSRVSLRRYRTHASSFSKLRNTLLMYWTRSCSRSGSSPFC